MIEASEILSRPGVANAFRALIAAEMQRANIKMGVAAQVAGALSDRLLAGENVPTATEVVAQVRAAVVAAFDAADLRRDVEKAMIESENVTQSVDAIVRVFTEGTFIAVAAARRGGLLRAADIVDDCRDDEVTDLRQVRDWIRSFAADA